MLRLKEMPFNAMRFHLATTEPYKPSVNGMNMKNKSILLCVCVLVWVNLIPAVINWWNFEHENRLHTLVEWFEMPIYYYLLIKCSPFWLIGMFATSVSAAYMWSLIFAIPIYNRQCKAALIIRIQKRICTQHSVVFNASKWHDDTAAPCPLHNRMFGIIYAVTIYTNK